MRKYLGIAAVSCLTFLAGCPRVSPLPAEQPAQPQTGPGSSTTTNGGVKTTRLGTGAGEYFIYEPTNPTPATAPVIAFIHAYGAVNPRAYGGWIKHMVQNGNIVIFPVYQISLAQPDTYTPNALAALIDAFATLNAGGHVKPDTSRFAFVSHSLGGPIAMNLAAVAEANGLPRPRAAFLANPGDSDSVFQSFGTLTTNNYDQIPADMRLIIIVGDQDSVVGTGTATELYNKVPQIPAGQREVVEFHSDSYGDPPLVASHGAPLAIDQSFDSGESLVAGGGTPPGLPDANSDSTLTDTLDFYGYWKLSDGLFQLAFAGTSQVVDDGGVTDLSMGEWSDGRPVTPATVLLP